MCSRHEEATVGSYTCLKFMSVIYMFVNTFCLFILPVQLHSGSVSSRVLVHLPQNTTCLLHELSFFKVNQMYVR